MSYYSDVRILIEEKNFNKLKKKTKDFCASEGTNNIMERLDIKSERIGETETKKKIKYIYFGWNCIKWYFDGVVEVIENFVKSLDEFHIIRTGENTDDIEEHHNLNKTCVNCIGVYTGFEDEI